MHRPLLPRLLPVAALLGLALLAFGCGGGRVRFVLLHTNDLHGQMLAREVRRGETGARARVGGFASIAAYVRTARQESAADGAEVLLVDAGDWYQGTPEGNRTQGTAVVEWMNLVGYDAATLGNHELDHGIENTFRLLGLAKFPVLAANVFDRKTGARPAGLRPRAVLRRRGIALAFVGLLSHRTPELTSAPIGEALRFEDETAVVREAVDEARREADHVFLLTHCGIDVDRALAALVPMVPAIVGGHSHTRLLEPVKVGQTLVVQTGAKGEAIGRVEFEAEEGTKALRITDARLVDLLPEATGEDPASAAIVRREEAAVRAEMEEQIGELLADLGRGSGPGSSPAGNLTTDAMREASAADIAFTNKGGVRAALLAGPVTRRSFFEMLPFDNTVVVLEMTGAEVAEALRASLSKEARTPLEVSGLEARWRPAGDGKAEFLGATFGGAPLDPGRTYRVAVNSFLAGGGDGYASFTRPKVRRDTGILVRDAAVEWFRKRTPFRPKPEDRLRSKP
ncbi:MAG TPA: bifunctional UDP-sugar hydrolase/5'-nucleotidase [Planctomycetota bacterium]|jgi:2',3'-cyclic-nucleotide 2'-phosphodiesterase (5'-nucleotidase family)|nr:bifunctional UDP-sugar hydrolase/5'-nucleotidase [Planctomycetota bacterium]